MVQKRPKEFVEFHDGEREFCPESGPLKRKKIKTPSAIVKALTMTVATAATVYVAVLAPIFSFVPSLVGVVDNSATIEVQIENMPDNSNVVYTLSYFTTQKIVDSGDVYDDQVLVFSDLEYDEEYIVTFYLEQDGKQEVIDTIKFKTNKEVIVLPDPIVPIVPEVPDTPDDPIVPEVPNTPVQPVKPNKPVVPETPVEPNDPQIEIEVLESTYNGAEVAINNDEAIGYILEETHVFTNVCSNEYTIQINQNGEITNYREEYDEETQTLTITFIGNPVGFGETATSEVVLTYQEIDVISQNTITTPKIDNLNLEVVYNQDGTYSYFTSSEGIEPSIGSVENKIILYSDLREVSSNPMIETYTMDSVTMNEEYTMFVNAPGKELVAFVSSELVWSLDTTQYIQVVEKTLNYHVVDNTEMVFTDITREGAGYTYTVNVKFANMKDITPTSMSFYRQAYNPVFKEEDPEELITTLDVSQITKDDQDNILAEYRVTEEQAVYSEAAGHTYRVVLTYVDANNVEQTMETINHIEPLSPVFNHINSVMWEENGMTYVDYEMVFSVSKTYSPKGVALLYADAYNWNVLSSKLEMTDTQGYVRGKMSSDAKYELSLNLYLDWLETAEEDYIYSGCGGADYIESLITRQDVIKNDTGYDSVVEEFTFVDVAKIFSDYSEEYVLVTLADGSKIKVTETMADSTGTVVVNWNDNNNVVVTVNQTNVSLGQVTVVDLVKQSVRDEEMMYGLVNSHTYRCFSNY